MTLLCETNGLSGGILASSFVLGTILGERILKKLLPAFCMGLFFALTVRMRGDLGPAALRDWGLALILFLASDTDLRIFEIPDRLIAAGIVLWLLWLLFGCLTGETDALIALVFGSLAAILYSSMLLILSLAADRIFRKKTLGGGDIKLIFMVMLHLGILGGFLCIAFSLVSGIISILVRRDRQIPWAPSITAGTLAVLLSGAFLIRSGILLFSF